MSNDTFHRLCLEWEANYKYNDVFRAFVELHYPDLKSTDIVCGLEIQKCQEIRKLYKKSHKIWFRDYYDAGIYIEMKPFGTETGIDLPKFLEWQKNH